MSSPKFEFPPPTLQLGFVGKLAHFRDVWLQDALLETVTKLDMDALDREVTEFVPKSDRSTLAGFGLRAELMFAVPLVLRTNPSLLGYYRLLMGYSQKEFYGTGKGFAVGHCKSMEEKGQMSAAAESDLVALASALCRSASALLAGITPRPVSPELLDDLTLLTVGPQLRGGANNARGKEGIDQVFLIIREIVEHAVVKTRGNAIEVENASGRRVVIQSAPDPDIIIREDMEDGHPRNVVAIEVKSGTDVSNIHNRIGEAEKSHQKARQRGFTEFWTVVNVHQLDVAKAKEESPTTNRFFALADLQRREGDEYADFRRRVLSLTAIPARS